MSLMEVGSSTMVKVPLLFLIALSLVAAEDNSSLSKDVSSSDLSLRILVKELYNNETIEKEKLNVSEKDDNAVKSETKSQRFNVTSLQVSQPDLHVSVDKFAVLPGILPGIFDKPSTNARKRINVKQIVKWPKLPKLNLGIPLGLRKPTLCNHEVHLHPDNNKMFLIQSNNYPGPFPPGYMCRWIIKSPVNTRISVTCDTFSVPKCVGCRNPEGFYVSRSGDPEFKDAKSYSGQSFPRLESASNSLSIIFLSQRNSKIRDGRFNCKVKLTKDDVSTATLSECSCGWTNNKFRIVNGQQAGVNEYPFMCGLVTADDAQIVCGCTLISNSYVVTAAHCLRSLDVSTTAVVLGEHDVNSGSDTSSTVLIRADEFKPYPYYDSETERYDIGLVKLQYPVPYSQNIGPVCLPFSSGQWDLRGQDVTILGWGTTEFGGQRSSVLMKTSVNIIDMSYCNDTYGSRVSWDTQYCTYRDGTDACQYDSGGPLVWRNPYSGLSELVATVEYGWGCAMGYPSINNRIVPFLQWIVDNTPGETFCY